MCLFLIIFHLKKGCQGLPIPIVDTTAWSRLRRSKKLPNELPPFPGLATVSPPRAVTSAGPVEVREIAGSPGN